MLLPPHDASKWTTGDTIQTVVAGLIVVGLTFNYFAVRAAHRSAKMLARQQDFQLRPWVRLGDATYFPPEGSDAHGVEFEFVFQNTGLMPARQVRYEVSAVPVGDTPSTGNRRPVTGEYGVGVFFPNGPWNNGGKSHSVASPCGCRIGPKSSWMVLSPIGGTTASTPHGSG
jgi:hypothetical protein